MVSISVGSISDWLGNSILSATGSARLSVAVAWGWLGRWMTGLSLGPRRSELRDNKKYFEYFYFCSSVDCSEFQFWNRLLCQNQCILQGIHLKTHLQSKVLLLKKNPSIHQILDFDWVEIIEKCVILRWMKFLFFWQSPVQYFVITALTGIKMKFYWKGKKRIYLRIEF